MAHKRFTDIEIWSDPWYRKLSWKGKLFWKFVLDRCDNAGFWKKDNEMASFQCGFKFTANILAEINEGKVRIFNHKDHLEVVDFIPFQYGELNPECRPHKPIIALLKSYRSKGYRKGINTLVDTDKDKDKDMDKEKGEGSGGDADFVEADVEIPKGYEKSPDLPEVGPEIAEGLNGFKAVNSRYKQLFHDLEQIEAMKTLFQLHTNEQVLLLISHLPQTNSERFMPKVYTPKDLLEKWDRLVGNLRSRVKDDIKNKVLI